MQTIEEKLKILEPLAKSLLEVSTTEQKLKILESEVHVGDFECSDEERVVLLSMKALGELDRFEDLDDPLFKNLIHTLLDTESFYSSIGGLVGYHATFIRLLIEERTPRAHPISYKEPIATDLTHENKEYILAGIENLKHAAFIFPVGGAGDRLDLKDQATGESLPAAKLKFGGQTLLEILFEYVGALEYLYFKMTGIGLQIPVALMASQEKRNFEHITTIFDQKLGFQREDGKTLFCTQPLSPVITTDGRWAFKSDFKLFMKPGGHGVIWKLAIESGIFEAFKNFGVQKALVRQINNPVVSLDHTLLTFLGEAFKDEKAFGFVTCERPVHVAEGVIVKRIENGIVSIRNIEYTDFIHEGIKDAPKEEGSLYSKFPANTNILAVDLNRIEEEVKKDPFPGLLVNPKGKFKTIDGLKYGGRLETTMQNIADHFVANSEGLLETFVAYGPRMKTLATTKQLLKSGLNKEQTAEKAFFDRLCCYWHLLAECGFDMEPLCSFDEFVEKRPNYLFHLHPALGPLYSIITQKIRGGKIAEGSELKLHLAELDVENLELSGSLIIDAHSPLGKVDENGVLQYGNECGRCTLKNVKIKNLGIDQEKVLSYWQDEFTHKERCQIILHGNAEFFAQDVDIEGSQFFEIPSGKRLTLTPEGKKLESIEKPSWYWKYDSSIVLKRTETV